MTWTDRYRAPTTQYSTATSDTPLSDLISTQPIDPVLAELLTLIGESASLLVLFLGPEERIHGHQTPALAKATAKRRVPVYYMPEFELSSSWKTFIGEIEAKVHSIMAEIDAFRTSWCKRCWRFLSGQSLKRHPLVGYDSCQDCLTYSKAPIQVNQKLLATGMGLIDSWTPSPCLLHHRQVCAMVCVELACMDVRLVCPECREIGHKACKNVVPFLDFFKRCRLKLITDVKPLFKNLKLRGISLEGSRSLMRWFCDREGHLKRFCPAVLTSHPNAFGLEGTSSGDVWVKSLTVEVAYQLLQELKENFGDTKRKNTKILEISEKLAKLTGHQLKDASIEADRLSTSDLQAPPSIKHEGSDLGPRSGSGLPIPSPQPKRVKDGSMMAKQEHIETPFRVHRTSEPSVSFEQASANYNLKLEAAESLVSASRNKLSKLSCLQGSRPWSPIPPKEGDKPIRRIESSNTLVSVPLAKEKMVIDCIKEEAKWEPFDPDESISIISVNDSFPPLRKVQQPPPAPQPPKTTPTPNPTHPPTLSPLPQPAKPPKGLPPMHPPTPTDPPSHKPSRRPPSTSPDKHLPPTLTAKIDPKMEDQTNSQLSQILTEFQKIKEDFLPLKEEISDMKTVIQSVKELLIKLSCRPQKRVRTGVSNFCEQRGVYDNDIEEDADVIERKSSVLASPQRSLFARGRGSPIVHTPPSPRDIEASHFRMAIPGQRIKVLVLHSEKSMINLGDFKRHARALQLRFHFELLSSRQTDQLLLEDIDCVVLNSFEYSKYAMGRFLSRCTAQGVNVVLVGFSNENDFYPVGLEGPHQPGTSDDSFPDCRALPQMREVFPMPPVVEPPTIPYRVMTKLRKVGRCRTICEWTDGVPMISTRTDLEGLITSIGFQLCQTSDRSIFQLVLQAARLGKWY